MRQIVLDTETTGLKTEDGHRVIEIGCVELVNRRFTGNNFHHYINPEREVAAGALKIHGISNGFLISKAKFSEIYAEFVTYIEGAELIIHNAPFDLGFLNHEFKLLSRKNKAIERFCAIIDTLVMAREMNPGQRNSLDALCKRYHIDNSHRDFHGALLDAQILAQVYLAMTGGQRSLFEDTPELANEENAQAKDLSETTTKKVHWDLKVIQATEAELKRHQAYLDRLYSLHR